ncbi:GAF and ANTAR domain-containing protein [Pseudonocardia sp. KRD-291]|nr:GAF and ANTAR domain-containing protein [Pseudonocardia sp. KRD291]
MLVDGAERVTRRGGLRDLDQTLRALVDMAVQNVPGADFGGFTMREDGRLTTRAPSDAAIVELDRLQAELGEGPCATALSVGGVTVVQVDDFVEEHGRWPRFAPAATRAGVQSLVSFAMAPRDAAPGAMNLYSRRRAAFGEVDRALGAAFASQVAVAVYGARMVEHMQRALGSRDVIGQAKGILMERFGLGAEEAFELLVRSSQDSNLKLYDVAQWLTGGGPHGAGIDPRSPASS